MPDMGVEFPLFTVQVLDAQGIDNLDRRLSKFVGKDLEIKSPVRRGRSLSELCPPGSQGHSRRGGGI